MGILDEALGPRPEKRKEIEDKLRELNSQVFRKRRGRPPGVKNKPKKRAKIAKTLDRENDLAEKGQNHEFKAELREAIASQVEKVETKLVTPHITRPHRKSGWGGYFREEVRARCLEMLSAGASMSKVAQALGVSLKTVYNWKSKSEDFEIKAEEARGLADEMVESKLFRRAVGYEAPKEVVQFSKEGDILRAPTFQHVPPDVEAAKFWLKNRKPTQWRDHIDTDITLIPRLIVQTHLGDEVLHDAKTIEENTPKLLSGSDTEPQDERTDEDEGVDSPEEENEPQEANATNPDDLPSPESK